MINENTSASILPILSLGLCGKYLMKLVMLNVFFLYKNEKEKKHKNETNINPYGSSRKKLLDDAILWTNLHERMTG